MTECIRLCPFDAPSGGNNNMRPSVLRIAPISLGNMQSMCGHTTCYATLPPENRLARALAWCEARRLARDGEKGQSTLRHRGTPFDTPMPPDHPPIPQIATTKTRLSIQGGG